MAATIYDEYATEVESAYYKQREKKLDVSTDANTSKQAREPQLSASVAAVLGPEHTTITPLRNGNGTHKQTREDRVRSELGDPPKRYDEIAYLRSQGWWAGCLWDDVEVVMGSLRWYLEGEL